MMKRSTCSVDNWALCMRQWALGLVLVVVVLHQLLGVVCCDNSNDTTTVIPDYERLMVKSSEIQLDNFTPTNDIYRTRRFRRPEGGSSNDLDSNDHPRNTQDSGPKPITEKTSTTDIINDKTAIRGLNGRRNQRGDKWISKVDDEEQHDSGEASSITPETSSSIDEIETETDSSSSSGEKCREEVNCILGKSEIYLSWWINSDGSLREPVSDDAAVQNTSSLFVDLSGKGGNELTVLEKLKRRMYDRRANNVPIVFMSLASNHLNRVPYSSLVLVNGTLEYLSLAGNLFTVFNATSITVDDDWATFPVLDKLKELDLRNCSIQAIHEDAFYDMTSLHKMYLSYNNLFAISSNTFATLTNLVHLDMANNEMFSQITNYQPDIFELFTRGLAIDENAFANLNSLKFMDFSHTKLEPNSIKAFGKMPPNLEQLSLCYTGIPVIGLGMFEHTTNLKVLDLSGNSALTTTMRRDSFHGLETSLEILSIENSNLKSLTWMYHLQSLKMLKLGGNNINQLANDSFGHLPTIEILDLSGNHIGNWYFRAFTKNKDLKILNLRNNNINVITTEMMKDFEALEFLGLGGNRFICNCMLRDLFDQALVNSISNGPEFTNPSPKIDDILIESVLEHYMTNVGLERQLPPEFIPDDSHFYDSFTRIYRSYFRETVQSKKNFEITRKKFKIKRRKKFKHHKSFTNLSEARRSKRAAIQFRSDDHVLEAFSDNPMEFNFQLLDFDEAYYICFNSTSNEEYFLTELESCLNDRIAEWSQLAQQLRQTNSNFSTAIVIVFVIMFILCICYYKWWYIRYFCILIKNATILSFLDKEASPISPRKSIDGSKSDMYLYDVFVSYCDENRDWVLDEMLPNIEQRQEISICLHERDFQVGLSILENIISCMDRSKCLLLVVSQSFLLSQWCQFEMHLAQHRLLETCRDAGGQLVLILLEDIPKRKRPKTLEYLMKTKTYIKWPNVDLKPNKSKSNSSRSLLDERKIFWKRLRKALIEHDWEPDSTYV